MRLRFLLPLLAAFTLCAGGQTPETPPAPTPPPATPAPTAVPAPPTVPPAAEAPKPAPVVVPAKERTVYIPFEDLAKTLANEGQGVFLPYREFLDMWNQLQHQQQKEKAALPVDAVVSSLEYTGKVEGDAALLTATLQVESFKEEGWAVLPISKPGLNIARSETGEATLRLSEGGYEVLLPKKGKYTLKLELLARVDRSSGRQTIRLVLPKAPVSRCTIVIPEEGWEFTLNPAAAHTVKPNGQGASELSFFFGEADQMEVWWQKQGGDSKLTPLLFAEMQQRVAAGAGTIQNSLDISYRILRAGVNSFTLEVPNPHQVLAVTGGNIKEWNVTAGADANAPQLLVVTLHAAARDVFQLQVQLEAGVENLPAELKIPMVSAQGVVRQRGSIMLDAAADLDITVKDLSGLNQQELTPIVVPLINADGNKRPPALLGNYRYLKLPFAATLSVKRAEPQVEVATATLVETALDTVKFTTRADVTVKRSGIFSLRIQVPMDFDNIEATGDLVENSKTEEKDGKRFLDVRFNKKVTDSGSFVIKGRLIRENPEQDITVPVFSPQNILRHEALVGVAVHSSLDPNTKEMGGLRQEDLQSILAQLPKAESDQTLPTQAFRYRGEAAPAVIKFELKQSQVTGDLLALIELREQATRYTWWVNYEVLYAGVDTYVISVPKAISKDLNLENSTLVKEVDKAFKPEKPAADRDYWKITLRDKKMGLVGLKLTVEVPLKELTAGQVTQINLPELLLEGVFQQIGQTAITKDNNLEVLESKQTNLEMIDPKELRASLANQGVILAYKHLKSPEVLTLSVSKNLFLSVPQAIVTYAVINTVVSADSSSSNEVIYWVKNNAQQFMSLEMPPGGRILSDVFVDGTPQQPMRRADKNDVLIRLPGADANREFAVRFLYEIVGEKAGTSFGSNGKFTTAVPKLNTGILQTKVTLHLPRDYNYLNFEGAMLPSHAASGWTDVHRRFRWLIPVLGPDLPASPDTQWPTPPNLSESAQGGFNLNLPKDGKPYGLYRLGEPQPVTVTYRKATLDKTLQYGAMILTILMGILLARRAVEVKGAFFAIVGLGSLAARGILPPAWAGLLESIWLGVIFSVLIWLLVGFFRTISKLGDPSPAKVGSQPSGTTPPHSGPATPARKTGPMPTVAGVAATAPPEAIPLTVAPEQVISPAPIFTETPHSVLDSDPAEPLPPFPSEGKTGGTDGPDAPSK